MAVGRGSGARALLPFALGLVIGGGVVRLADGAGEPPPSPAPHRAHPLVCETVPLAGSSSPVSRDLGLRFCLAQLEAANTARRRVVQPWPEVDDPVWAGELPDAWTDAMERVVHDCDVPGALVLTDCSEPPCAAVFRDAEWERLMEALGDCPTFREAFPNPEIDPVPYVVPCGDGRFETMVLVTTFDADQRRAYFEELGVADEMDNNELSAFLEGYRMLSRRADGLTPIWNCAEP